MISCDLTSPDATCPRCGFRSKIRDAIRRCRKPAPRHCGPGCQLIRTFAWFGIRDDGKCGCAAMARKMDAWGDECWQHLEEIVDHLREAAAKRGIPFLATAARIAVGRAIEAAARERVPLDEPATITDTDGRDGHGEEAQAETTARAADVGPTH